MDATLASNSPPSPVTEGGTLADAIGSRWTIETTDVPKHTRYPDGSQIDRLSSRVAAEEPTITSLRSHRSLDERLRPTLELARKERDKARFTARYTRFLVNLAVSLQIMLGALVTGLAAYTTGHLARYASILTAISSGITAISGAYLARINKANEPEASRVRTRELDYFICDVDSFLLDYGSERVPNYASDEGERRPLLEQRFTSVPVCDDLEKAIVLLRQRFETLMLLDLSSTKTKPMVSYA